MLMVNSIKQPTALKGQYFVTLMFILVVNWPCIDQLPAFKGPFYSDPQVAV